MRWVLGLAVCAWLFGALGCGGAHGRGNAPLGGSGASGAGSAAGPAGAGSGGEASGRGGSGGQSGQSGTGGARGSAGLDAGTDAGGRPDAGDASVDSGTVGAGPFAVPELPFPVEPGEPITAPERRWTFVAFPDSRCANGTPTGIAINPIANPKGLLIFMAGGGACWDATTCLVTDKSIHLHDTVDQAVVLGEASMLSGLFDHGNAANPFADYGYVYMPYCTGDLHIGTQAKTYQGPNGSETVHHQGGLNVEAYLARIVATFPNVPRVVVSGISAGGFGATLNWWRYQGAFPRARVDVLDDAGLIVDPAGGRWPMMVEAWAVALPPGCAACAQRLTAFLPFYGEHMVAPRRYALVGFLGDAVIAEYFGLTGEQVGAQLLGVRASAAANQKTFFLAGSQHTIIGEGALMTAGDGSSFLPWLLQFAGDAPEWNHAGP